MAIVYDPRFLSWIGLQADLETQKDKPDWNLIKRLNQLWGEVLEANPDYNPDNGGIVKPLVQPATLPPSFSNVGSDLSTPDNKDPQKLLTDLLSQLEKARNPHAKTVQGLVSLREHFRQQKQWAEADDIRKKLGARGITLVDTPNGPHIKGN